MTHEPGIVLYYKLASQYIAAGKYKLNFMQSAYECMFTLLPFISLQIDRAVLFHSHFLSVMKSQITAETAQVEEQLAGGHRRDTHLLY